MGFGEQSLCFIDSDSLEQIDRQLMARLVGGDPYRRLFTQGYAAQLRQGVPLEILQRVGEFIHGTGLDRTDFGHRYIRSLMRLRWQLFLDSDKPETDT